MSGFFYNLGRQLGRRAVPAIRQSKWIWQGLAGTEEETLRAEHALGQAMAVELRSLTPPVEEPSVQALTGNLCRRLSAGVRDKRREFHCVAVHDPHPNALALPGGFLFVSLSLMDLCERRPDELAFALGHEMAHVLRGHAWDRLLNEAALRAASALTVRAGPLSAWLRHQGLGLLRNAYAQDRELEADELGLRLAAAAGFAPEGAITLLRRLEQRGPHLSELGQYFASHPPPAQRIARLGPLGRQLAAGSGGSPGQ